MGWGKKARDDKGVAAPPAPDLEATEVDEREYEGDAPRDEVDKDTLNLKPGVYHLGFEELQWDVSFPSAAAVLKAKYGDTFVTEEIRALVDKKGRLHVKKGMHTVFKGKDGESDTPVKKFQVWIALNEGYARKKLGANTKVNHPLVFQTEDDATEDSRQHAAAANDSAGKEEAVCQQKQKSAAAVAFAKYNLDGNGHLDIDEFRQGICALHGRTLTDHDGGSESCEWMERADRVFHVLSEGDAEAGVDILTYSLWIEDGAPDDERSLKAMKRANKMMKLFVIMDADGSGQVSRDEMRDFLVVKPEECQKMSEKKFDKLWGLYDKDGSGSLDYAEYSHYKSLPYLHNEPVDMADFAEWLQQDGSLRAASHSDYARLRVQMLQQFTNLDISGTGLVNRDDFNQVMASIAEGNHGKGKMITTSKLAVACASLRKADSMSDSDPVVVLFTKPDLGSPRWSELCRTECIDNEHNPVFQTKLKVSFDDTKSGSLPLKFMVYDLDYGKADLKPNNLLGEYETTVKQVMQAPELTTHVPLIWKSKSSGSITVKVKNSKVADSTEVPDSFDSQLIDMFSSLDLLSDGSINYHMFLNPKMEVDARLDLIDPGEYHLDLDDGHDVKITFPSADVITRATFGSNPDAKDNRDITAEVKALVDPKTGLLDVHDDMRTALNDNSENDKASPMKFDLFITTDKPIKRHHLGLRDASNLVKLWHGHNAMHTAVANAELASPQKENAETGNTAVDEERKPAKENAARSGNTAVDEERKPAKENAARSGNTAVDEERKPAKQQAAVRAGMSSEADVAIKPVGGALFVATAAGVAVAVEDDDDDDDDGEISHVLGAVIRAAVVTDKFKGRWQQHMAAKTAKMRVTALEKQEAIGKANSQPALLQAPQGVVAPEADVAAPRASTNQAAMVPLAESEKPSPVDQPSSFRGTTIQGESAAAQSAPAASAAKSPAGVPTLAFRPSPPVGPSPGAMSQRPGKHPWDDQIKQEFNRFRVTENAPDMLGVRQLRTLMESHHVVLTPRQFDTVAKRLAGPLPPGYDTDSIQVRLEHFQGWLEGRDVSHPAARAGWGRIQNSILVSPGAGSSKASPRFSSLSKNSAWKHFEVLPPSQ